MAEEPAASPVEVEPTAPAPSPAPADQVSIQLGPHLDLYPTELRPAPTEPAPEPAPATAVPEVAPSTTPSQAEPPAAGPAEEQQGSRRRANQDAYERGVTEGRAALEREQQQAQTRATTEQTQREANQRVEKLFGDLESQDYATQDRARREILGMYRGNREASALMQTTRQQILAEMAVDFSKLGEIAGIDQAGYQSLHAAPSAAELAKRAFELGKSSRDDQIVRLEAELQGLRGRLMGSKATPEARNGAGSIEPSLTLEQYQRLSPKEAAKLPASAIDAMMQQLVADAERNGR
jgi:hypothetical protein